MSYSHSRTPFFTSGATKNAYPYVRNHADCTCVYTVRICVYIRFRKRAQNSYRLGFHVLRPPETNCAIRRRTNNSNVKPILFFGQTGTLDCVSVVRTYFLFQRLTHRVQPRMSWNLLKRDLVNHNIRVWIYYSRSSEQPRYPGLS